MKKVITVALLIIGMWLVASFIDVTMHNSPTEENFENYASWNAFTMWD